MSVNEKMTAIADNIRSKTGGTKALTLDGMASGVNEVYEAGKTKEWSDFWDVLQVNGTRANYYYGFYSDTAGAWNDVNFKPKYDLKPSTIDRFLRYSRITNLKEICEKQGIVFDTSNCTKFGLSFGDCASLEVVPAIDISKATTSNSTLNMFNEDRKLHTIEKLIVSENTLFDSPFKNCTLLSNIIFEGVIGRSISFSASPLTVASMKSIITHLKNYSGTTDEFKYSLTLTSACKTSLEAEGTTSPNGNLWTEYVSDLGWNLV